MNLYVNASGDSVLSNWTYEELQWGFNKANDDEDYVFKSLLQAEYKRRFEADSKEKGQP